MFVITLQNTVFCSYFNYYTKLQMVLQQGRIQDFSKGGSQSNGYNYINYIIIAIIHIINLNKVHCSLLKAIGA